MLNINWTRSDARRPAGNRRIGRKKDVPGDDCDVGWSGNCDDWVGPEGREALTEFTLTVLKFSTPIKETQTRINPGSVKFAPGDRGG